MLDGGDGVDEAEGGVKGFFFFNDTATTEIYTLSLHDALPISHFLLRQRTAFYTAHSSLRQRPLFLLTISRCGSAPAFYTAYFSLRQIGRAHV